MLGKLLGPDIREMIEERRLGELRETLMEFPAYDIADLIRDLSNEECPIIFRILPRTLATDVFEELSGIEQERLLDSLNQEKLREIIQAMGPDDRTAFLEELPAPVTRKLLRLLGPEERRIAQTLLAYPDDSVGRLMTPDYIDLDAEMTAGEAIEFIRRVGMTRETVYVCYVTREKHVLQGVVDLKELVLAPHDARVESLMREPHSVAHTNDDRNEAARAMVDYDLLALPVVDSDRRLVGIVTVDDVMDVLEEEATEDIQVMAGVLPETENSYLDQRLLGIAWRRGVPLLGLLVGQSIAGAVMRGSQAQIQAVVALAFFVPMIMATGGGMGIQTATLITRGFSTGEIALKDFLRTLGRELTVSLMLSLFLGAVAFGLSASIVTLGSGPNDFLLRIAITVAVTLCLVMTLSTVVGVLLPMLFYRMKLDPAIMTSPFLTTTVDILGLVIYFHVSGAILSG